MTRTKAQRRAAKKAAKAKVQAVAKAKAGPPIVATIDFAAEAKRKVAATLKATTPMAWYMLQVYGGEREVEKALRLRGFDVFAPRETFLGKRMGRPARVRVVRPIFYGYVFVVIDVNAGQHFDDVTSIEPKLGRFLKPCGAEHPRMLRPWYVERLRLMEEFGVFDHRPATPRVLAADELVRIVGGDYCGHFARVLRAKTGERRVQLLLETMDVKDDGVPVDVADVRAVYAGGDEPKIAEVA